MEAMIKTCKKFDCVEFKCQSQIKLMQEFEKRKDEFISYMEFIKTKVREDKWSQQIWNRIGGK